MEPSCAPDEGNMIIKYIEENHFYIQIYQVFTEIAVSRELDEVKPVILSVSNALN